MATSKKKESFQEKAEEKIEDIKLKVEAYQDSLVEYTRKNPMTALALAAGAGLLIGAVWTVLRGRK